MAEKRINFLYNFDFTAHDLTSAGVSILFWKMFFRPQWFNNRKRFIKQIEIDLHEVVSLDPYCYMHQIQNPNFLEIINS